MITNTRNFTGQIRIIIKANTRAYMYSNKAIDTTTDITQDGQKECIS